MNYGMENEKRKRKERTLKYIWVITWEWCHNDIIKSSNQLQYKKYYKEIRKK